MIIPPFPHNGHIDQYFLKKKKRLRRSMVHYEVVKVEYV